MAKYIPDSYLYRAIGADIEGRCGRCTQSRSDCMCHSLSRMDICGILEDAATVDVVEVKHGKWIHSTDADDGHCSVCNCDMPMFKEDWEWRYCETPYCPNCGAKMEDE